MKHLLTILWMIWAVQVRAQSTGNFTIADSMWAGGVKCNRCGFDPRPRISPMSWMSTGYMFPHGKLHDTLLKQEGYKYSIWNRKHVPQRGFYCDEWLNYSRGITKVGLFYNAELWLEYKKDKEGNFTDIKVDSAYIRQILTNK